MLEDVLAALAEAPLAGIMVNTLDPAARPNWRGAMAPGW